jgi:hypothetical protein
MFGSNQIDIVEQMVEMHRQDLLCEAKDWQRVKQSGLQPAPVARGALYQVGTALIALGERLAGIPARVGISTQMNQDCVECAQGR